MTKRPQNRLTRRSAKRALDHEGSSGDARVDAILAASTAPATGAELNREADTVAMFRAGRLSTPPAERLTMIQVTRKRLAAAKVAVAATAAVLLAGGGVAFAASTGNLPEVLGGGNKSDNGSQHSSQAPGQEGKVKPGKPTPSGSPTGGPAGTPNPSLKGKCQAYQAGATSNPGKAAQNPAFSALADAAGGTDKIAVYCTALIGAPGSKPTGGPTDGPGSGQGNGQGNKPDRPVDPTKAPKADKSPKADKTPNPNKPTAKPTRTPNPNKPTDKPSKTPNPNKPTKAPKTPTS